jgi:hypothetical protein
LILVELKESLDAYRGLSIFHLVSFFGETECGLGRYPLNVPLAGHPQGLPDRASLIAVQLFSASLLSSIFTSQITPIRAFFSELPTV